MSARSKLEGLLPGGLGVALADEILNEHAHELAEKIWRRADLDNVGIDEGGGWHEGMRDASILIAPEA